MHTEKLRERQRQWPIENRKAWLAKSGPCVLCQNPKTQDAIDLIAKRKVLAHLWYASRATRREVLAKCAPACQTCILHLKKATKKYKRKKLNFKGQFYMEITEVISLKVLTASYLMAVLRYYGGNKSKTAKGMGMSIRWVRNALDRVWGASSGLPWNTGSSKNSLPQEP